MKFNKSQLTAVLAAASSDITRYNICGVRFEAERMIATDGHRLHLVDGDKTPMDAPVTIAYESCKRIIKAMGPHDTAEIIKASKIEGSAVIHVSPSGIELTCEVIAGVFPDYSKVVPEKSDTKRRLIVSARYLKELCEAAIKAEGMGKNSTSPILFELPEDELSPIRVDGQCEHTFTAVLMPQRGK